MNRQPDPKLLEQYGNQWCLEKTAKPGVAGMLGSIAAHKRLVGAAGAVMILADQSQVRKQRMEAARINLAVRRLEARKMNATVRGFGGPTGPQPGSVGDITMDEYGERALEESLFKGSSAVAASVGADMAKQAIAQALVRGWKSGVKAAVPAAPAATGGTKKLFSTATKAKAVGGVAALGGGYAGYKGMSKARDFITAENPDRRWGGGARRLNNVNQYGVATY